MLVLTRKVRESVVIGRATGFRNKLKITVLEINGVQVRLGFEADKSVSIYRREVWERRKSADDAQLNTPTSAATSSVKAKKRTL
jgi:carbon storage regulator